MSSTMDTREQEVWRVGYILLFFKFNTTFWKENFLQIWQQNTLTVRQESKLLEHAGYTGKVTTVWAAGDQADEWRLFTVHF
jgi:hypothetical protein